MNNTRMNTEVKPYVLRAQAARRAISERFLAAAQTAPAPHQGPLGLPAYLSLRSIRTNNDGSLSFTLQVPVEHVPDIYLPLTTMCGMPLAVTVEIIDIGDEDPFCA